MAVLPSRMDLFALATLAARADEAGGPPPTKFYELRDNLRIAALAEAHELAAISSIGQLGGGDGRERTALALARVRDAGTGAVYGLRYRLRLVRGDRWYVAAVNQTTPKEG